MEPLKISFSPLLKLEGKKIVIDTNYPANNNYKKDDSVIYNGECGGVYVWGFKENNRFIPYYVGEAINSIATRIITEHKRDIENAKSTYIRLSREYMTGDKKTIPYWYDPDFPPLIEHNQGIPKWWCKETETQKLGKVSYWKFKDGDGVEKGFEQYCNDNSVTRESIDCFCTPNSDKKGKFTLREDFRVFYWDIKSIGQIFDVWEKVKSRSFLQIFEAYIKFSLKGKTCSESISIEAMKDQFRKYFIDTDIVIGNGPYSKFYYSESLMNAKYHNDRSNFKREIPEDPYLI